MSSSLLRRHVVISRRSTQYTHRIPSRSSRTLSTLNALQIPPRNRWLNYPLALAITVTACVGSLVYLSPRLYAHVHRKNLEAELQSSIFLQVVRLLEDASEWDETRLPPSSSKSEVRLGSNLTSMALRAPGKIALDPLVQTKKDLSKSRIFVHLGRDLGDPDGLVHGELLMKLLDEAIERTVSGIPLS